MALVIVYGKRERWIEPHAELAKLADACDGWTSFLSLCEIAQGLIDHETGSGPDRLSTLRTACHCAALAAAEAAVRDDDDARRRLAESLATLAATPLPGRIQVRQPEGFSFYDLHPDSWIEAGRGLACEGRDIVVIGLRSIGLALGACVAVACGAGAFETLRPRGHPFARRIEADARLTQRICLANAVFIIVDEGPGLSGSSIAACVAWLAEQGAALGNINILASHDGAPGTAASESVRALWRRVRRRPAPASGGALAGGPAHWFEAVTGRCAQTDVSAGRWRARQPCAAHAPVDAARERRKFLLEGEDGRLWLARFAGLGSGGEAALRRSAYLAECGFVAPPRAHARGYILTPWFADARSPVGRAGFAEAAGAYLGRRGALLDGAAQGASLRDLADMALANIAEASGSETAGRLAWIQDEAARLQARCRPMEQDGRVQAWEWLDTAQGLIKCDAIDHCAGHDMIGAQDVAWDFAGLHVEFGAPFAETALTIGERELGRMVNVDLVRFMTICWIGFETGRAGMALTGAAPSDAAALRARLVYLDSRLSEAAPEIQRSLHACKELTSPPDVAVRTHEVGAAGERSQDHDEPRRDPPLG